MELATVKQLAGPPSAHVRQAAAVGSGAGSNISIESYGVSPDRPKSASRRSSIPDVPVNVDLRQHWDASHDARLRGHTGQQLARHIDIQQALAMTLRVCGSFPKQGDPNIDPNIL